MKSQEVYTMRNLKKGFIACFKITILFTILFGFILKQSSLEGILITFVISAMFTYGMGFGNGLINSYLDTKWNWIEQTNQRVIAGIIATVLYSIPLVLSINYVTLIKVCYLSIIFACYKIAKQLILRIINSCILLN